MNNDNGYIEVEEVAFGAVLLILVGIVFACIFFVIHDYNRVNRINDNFTNHCRTLGGTTIIDDKDLCVAPDGRVIDHE